ncbi:MAG TPA: Spy/CpxP family protein refolding chaperone [Thermoanaerobaculia bacterium]|nr:Spy/CpxP family protein refolding chaperone [Thermoanaerobaculia bacterium]
MKKTIAAVAALALTATLAVAAPGEGRKGRHGKHGKGEFSAKFAEKLNLSEAQKAQIKSLQDSFRAENEPFRQQALQLRTDLKAAREANDTTRAEALKAQLQAQREQMKPRMQAQHERILSILTAEQRAQLETMKSERKGRRGGAWKNKTQ